MAPSPVFRDAKLRVTGEEESCVDASPYSVKGCTLAPVPERIAGRRNWASVRYSSNHEDEDY